MPEPALPLVVAALLLLPPLSARAALPPGGVRNADAQQAAGGFGPLDPSPPLGGLTAEQVIRKFGERETAFQKAREQYTFRQTVKIQTIDDDKAKPDGEYQQVTDIVLSDGGGRSERVVFAPQNTLERLMLSQADFDDMNHRLPFVLTTADLTQYTLTYLGRQRVDSIDTYVFDCQPKAIEKNHRYYQGKVWVDQQDFEIVLITGKNVPDDLRRGHEDLSPPFTTYYQPIDGENWFPTYTKGEGLLHFAAQTGAAAQDVHIRYTIRYEDYKRFRAKSRIIYNGADLPPGDPAGASPAATPGASAPETAAPVSPTPDQPAPDPDAPSLKKKGK